MALKTPRDWDKQQIMREASFLQSEPWAEFQNSLGYKPHFLIEEDWSCVLYERRTAIGNYLLAPYGPTLAEPDILPSAIETMKNFGRQHHFDWLRIEPLWHWGGGAQIIPLLKASGARRAPHDAEPALTRIIDLKPEPEELLAAISATTRSFIRKNNREQFVSFKSSANPADIPAFAAMVSSVSSRTQAVFFNQNYYQRQAEILMPLKRLFLELAYIDSQPVGGIIMHDFGVKTSYTYAASLPRARDKNVSALLLWSALLNARQRGCQSFDLFGIAPEDASPNHPWYGFSAFKRKFGGRIVERSGTWDIPISPKYRLYRSAKTALRAIGWS